MSPARLAVTRLGQRGEGVAAGLRGPVYLPYALPGDEVLADIEGDRGTVLDLAVPSPFRIPPVCPYFGTCGGCAVQGYDPVPYAAWKRGLVADVLERAGLTAEVAPLVEAHGDGRRRATFHMRAAASPNLLADRDPQVGFMRARTHEIVAIDACPILAPGLHPALPALRRLARHLAPLGKPADLVATATDGGLDVDMRGLGPLAPADVEALSGLARDLDLARLSNHGSVVIERRAPVLMMGRAAVVPPPGAFLQATRRGEEALVAAVRQGVGPARKVADLFCGVGTFALRLAETATVKAVDAEGPALNALARAARAMPSLKPVSTEGRDLSRRPLLAADLARFDAVVFDPPRAGAEAQAAALAGSAVPTVVAVSCNPATFARDAALLVAGGYELGPVVPVDQFRYAAHVELVAVFRRRKQRPARRLFA